LSWKPEQQKEGKQFMKIFIVTFCALILLSFLISLWGQPRNEMPHGDMRIDCEECHTPSNWSVDPRKMTFRHEKTGFPLLGAHRNARCLDCHKTLEFSHIGSECIDCHTDIHQEKYGIRCERCHNTVSWENQTELREKHQLTEFPLTGVHALIDCEECHYAERKDNLVLLPIQCEGCHLQDYQTADNPNHQQAGFSRLCQECHYIYATSWNQTSFIHTDKFLLDGAHLTASCRDCHQSGYAGTPSECYACHSTDYQQATDPNHVVFGFLTVCQLCHNTSRWTGTSFNHLQASGFELSGAHTLLSCNDCHVNNQVSGLPTSCFGCHESDYRSVADPNHVLNNFDHDCLKCHTNMSWSPATFDHANTLFPLTGAHIGLDCIECHQSGYTAIPTDCYSCHQNDYNGVTDPSHVLNNFDHDCTICHNTQVWSPALFDHANTQFPLTGAHTGVACIDCHQSGYTNTPTDCYSCHQNDYNGVTDPSHVLNNFDHDCTICHNTQSWSPALFDHANTQFPLTGAHTGVACIDCHQSGYTNTPTDCYSCHQNDYNEVTDPSHVLNNFDHDCTICHNTQSWSPALFDHANTQFPLTGAHTGLVCNACHSTGYTNTPTDCYSCHQDDYNNTQDPNHTAAGFPTQCESCHNTSAWQPANWDHDSQYFPIYSGRHQSAWSTCADCHVDPNNYIKFECIFCHEHNDPIDLANKHQNVQGYQYDSQECYRCHPRGDS
jgi:nitrate/TMAO reductase-like tetraheme cytochrome c subunit